MKHKAALWTLMIGLLVLLAATDGFSQTYPLPRSSDAPSPAIGCATCPASYANLPTVGFSSPIKRFVGRYLDSQATGDKTVPVRTYRNRSVGVSLEGDRILVSMSSTLGAYRASTFFTELGRSLEERTWGAFLPLHFSVDPEARSSGWTVSSIHTQDSMSGAFDGGGFDWDDRGNTMIGYMGWGWGIVDASGRLIKQVNSGQVNTKVLTVRGASTYYVFSASSSASTGTEVYNVTAPATPALLRKINLTFSSAAKTSMAPNAPVALVYSDLSIFTPDALAAGGPALKVFPGPYKMVTSDGTSFYTVKQTPTSSISRISPSGTGYVETVYPIAGSFKPSVIRYGGGYLAVSGSDMDEGRFGFNLRLYRLEAGVPKEVDLKNFIMRYYGTPPPGFAKPENYTFPFEGHVVRQQNKDYLIVVAGGLGDVYELESGPVVPVAPDPEITVTGCVYAGDPCTLAAGSISGASTSAWTFSWTIDGVTSGTVKTITPAFTVAKTYAVAVSATNTVGTTTAAKGVPVLPIPVCDIAPSGVKIESSCGTTCSKDTPITFRAVATTYALKPCDTYAWSFPDGTTGTGSTITKTFTQVGQVTATLVVRNAAGAQAPATLPVEIVAMACPPPDNNLAVDFSGTSSGCYAGGSTSCAVGETINFSISRFSNVGTSSCHVITWTFPDGTDTNRTPSKAFSAAGTYTVTLNAAVSGGASRTASVVVPVGTSAEPPPPPPPSGCTVPSVYVDFTGNQGCSAINANCKVGEVLSLSPSSLASLPSCLTYRWEVTPGTAVYTTKNASHTLGAAGTYTIKLTATGSSTRTSTMNVTVSGTGTTPPPPPPTGCPSTAPGRYVSIGYTGATSGCTVGAPCQKNEVIAFKAESTFGGYVFQDCDTFEWNFGDGSAVSRQKDPTHSFTGNGPYTVRLTVTNSKGSVAPEAVVQIAGTGAKKPENVNFTFTGNTRVGAPLTFMATSTSEVPVTYSWDFNDSSPLETGATVTHTFTAARTYNVALTASNDGGPAAPKIIQVRIDPSTRFSFLLPAVASLRNGDGSKWLTDVQILNTNPATQPLELTFTFNGNGQSKNVSLTAVTSIYDNVVEQLLPGTSYSGAVTVSGDSPNVPQMWTRTYLASQTGVGTYGHFIPAVLLNTTQSVVTGPSTYFIPGVETSPNFRTNLQIVNPNATSIDIKVSAFDELGIPLGSFNDTVAPFALLQVRDLQARIPRVADGKPFSLELSNASGMNMVTYASMIDNKSNDPVYVAGVSALDAGANAMKQQIVPGVGRIDQGVSGTWKSDITLFNPDARGIEMNLTYIDGAGARYEAKNLRLPSFGSMRLADVLTSDKFATRPTGASSGIIILDTPTDTGISKFPVMYDRTYKDRIGLGTFGQGIGSFASARANVSKDAPAYITGIRNSSTYKSNVGVVSMAQGTTIVAVSLLDAGNDNIVKTIELAPGQSVIAPSIVPELLGALDKGSLKIQVLLGGPVWAYASIVDRLTEDPEYVPAVPSK